MPISSTFLLSTTENTTPHFRGGLRGNSKTGVPSDNHYVHFSRLLRTIATHLERGTASDTKDATSPVECHGPRMGRPSVFKLDIDPTVFKLGSKGEDPDSPGIFPENPIAELELPTSATLAKGLPGDFNNDGCVDLNDLNIVRNTFGQMGDSLAADADGNGIIDESDLKICTENFGKSSIEEQ